MENYPFHTFLSGALEPTLINGHYEWNSTSEAEHDNFFLQSSIFP